jgi:urease accessory protein
MSPSLLAVMLLADGRFPAGGHAHSAGVESAVADGRVHDEASLEHFVAGRLATSGLTDAALAVRTAHRVGTAASAADARALLVELEAEADARMAVAASRDASRRLGRQLGRVAARCWPAGELAELVGLFPDGAHQSVVFGCVGVAAGASFDDIAALVLHHSLTTPAQAGVRLLGLDPFGVAALLSRLHGVATAVASDAVRLGTSSALSDLPAPSAPLLDIAATRHADWDVRLFVT